LQIRDLVASGASARQAVIRVTGADASAAFTQYLKTHPERKAEIAALRRPQGKPSFDRIAANFDRLMTLIAEGHSAVEAGKVLGINGDRLTAYLLEHEEQRPAYVAAMHKRAKALGIRSTTTGLKRRQNFTDAEFDAALALIARSTAPDLATALRRADLPTNGSLQRRARKDPTFRAKLDRAYSAHAASTHYLRYIRDPDEPRLLLASLLRDPTFAAAFKKFGKLHEDKYDLAQEYCLAVLEGEDVKQPATIKGVRRRALLDSFRFTSLDAPAHDDSERETFGDTLAAPCIISHY
jgi:hypothetical protein